jgi:outer membrane protein
MMTLGKKERILRRRAQRSIVALVLALVAVRCVAIAENPPTKTLSECIAIALEHHPGLKAASAAVEAGHERTWEAAAKYLPDVSGLYTANRRRTSPAARTGASTDNRARTFDFYNTGVGLSQILFDFGQNLNSIRAAEAAEQSLRADEVTERETIVLNVKLSYFNVLRARRLLGVAQETIRQNQKHRDQARERFGVGFAPKFDVTQAQVQLATAELDGIAARNAVSLARETLRTALGLTAPVTFDLVDSFELHEVAVNEEDALSGAFVARPELQSLRASELALTEQLAALKKDYLPNVTAVATYNESGQSYPLSSNWNVGAIVNLSILNGGLTTAQIREANANLSQLRFNEEVLRLQVALEVRSAVLNLQQAAESIRVAEERLQEARENLHLAEERYSTGIGNIIELTDAQALLTTAQASHVESIYAYKIALASLEKATASSFTPNQ